MDTTEMPDQLHRLEAAERVQIAQLHPDLTGLENKSVRGVVTLTWPYSSVRNSFAFVLAEPDFRFRRNKGQVRLNFGGAAARVVGVCGLGSNDEVTVCLADATWKLEKANKRQSLPGANIDWQLTFTDKVLLQVKSSETGNTKLIDAQHAISQESEQKPTTPPVDTDQIRDLALPDVVSGDLPIVATHLTEPNETEYESPAFIKRARASYGSLFELGYDIFEDDGGVRGKGRKRTRFGRDSSAWRYSSQSPSPEPSQSPLIDATERDSGQKDSAPNRRITDEGCQTMAADLPRVGVGSESPSFAVDNDFPISPKLSGEGVGTPSSADVVNDAALSLSPNGWMPTPAPIAPFDRRPVVPPEASTSVNTLESIFQPPPTTNTFGSPWNPQGTVITSGPSVMGSTAISIPSEPVPSNDFSAIFSTPPTVPFIEASPVRQNNSAIRENNAEAEGVPEQSDIRRDQEGSPYQSPPSIVHYPPLDIDHDVGDEGVQGVTHQDYPLSYLDNSDRNDRNDRVPRDSLNQGLQAALDVDRSSWATINNPFRLPSMSPTGRLGSAEDSTPEQAFVINESDESEENEDSPVPTAIEDTVNHGRADALELYEDAEVPDDADARYSDDDEPEYDANEMGGDYDTRKYVYPDDDEDDSHDEDLRPRQLEPEFEDGEGYDEEGESDEDEEYDEEYEMDDDIPPEQPLRQPLPTSRAETEVIDLISSSDSASGSEDESEAIGTPMRQPVTRTVPSSIMNNQHYSTSNTLSRETPSYGPPSGEEGSISDQESTNQNTEQFSEEDNNYDGHVSMKEDESMLSNSSEVEDQDMKDSKGERDRPQQSSDDEGSPDASRENQEIRADAIPTNDRVPISPADLADIVCKPQIGELTDNQAESNADDVVPFSAEDGLETLSRAVENESRMISQTITSSLVTNPDTIDPSLTNETEIAAKDAVIADEQSIVELALQQEYATRAVASEERVNTLPSSLDSTIEQEPLTNDEPTHAITLSSPPLSQPFQSNTPQNESINIGLIETITVGDLVPIDQLPTPLDTQLTDTAIEDPMELDEIREVEESTVLLEDTAEDIPAILEQPLTKGQLLVTETTVEQVEEKREPSTAEIETDLLEIEDGLHVRGNGSPALSSSLSLRTQVDNDDLTQADAVTTPKRLVQVIIEVSGQLDLDRFGISSSFRSQMDVDDELQASILEYAEGFDDASDSSVDAELPNRFEYQEEADLSDKPFDLVKVREDEVQGEAEDVHSSPATAPNPAQESFVTANSISTTGPVLHDKLVKNNDTVGESAYYSSDSEDDPSVQLARAANAAMKMAKRQEPLSEVALHTRSHDSQRSSSPQEPLSEVALHTRSHDLHESSSPQEPLSEVALHTRSHDPFLPSSPGASTTEVGRHERSHDQHKSPTPKTEDSSVQLAKATPSKAANAEEDSSSMTAAKLKLVRHLRDELPDCTSLKVLRQHLTKSLDVIVVAMMQPPEPQRAKGGPREYMMSFTVTDHSIGPYAVAEVQLYRPHKETLPVVQYGDIVLLRNFTVVSLQNKGFGLRSNETSSWAVFDREDEPAQIKGPPLEYGERETTYVAYMREWQGLLDDKAKEKLERANKKIIDAGRSKAKKA